MKFETIKIDFEKYESLDIISTSFGEGEDVTNPTTPVEPTTKYDPYENDKW